MVCYLVGWFCWMYSHVVRMLVHIAGDLNSVETYLDYGPLVPFKVMYCLSAWF